MLAKDEDDHVRILTNQYKSLMADGKLNLADVHPAEVDHGSQDVISDDFKRSIKRGKFEMAVISIGCDLENKAIAYYKEHAEKTDDPDLKQLFTWLRNGKTATWSSCWSWRRSTRTPTGRTRASRRCRYYYSVPVAGGG